MSMLNRLPSGSGNFGQAGESSGLFQDPSGTQTEKGPTGATTFGIWVAVRVRPFNKREIQESDKDGVGATPQSVVDLERDHKTLTLLDPTRGWCERANFHFDYVFSAFRPTVEFDADLEAAENKRKKQNSRLSTAGDQASSDDDDDDGNEEEKIAERAQAEVYKAFGEPIVLAAWQGYNGCIFAYGQTSSGKTYTMMGTKRDPGITPRLCRALFERIEEEQLQRQQEAQQHAELMQQQAASALIGSLVSEVRPPPRKMTKISVSYMEIYNEQVRDLLKQRPKNERRLYKSRFDTAAVDDGEFQKLRVRQHPLTGPFVEGLSTVEVSNWLECVRVIRQGNEIRASCSTAYNDQSSRSHAIFQMTVTQTEALGAKVRGKEVTNHKVSKINLVDLAGSERITKTNVSGKHITEANYINQSLLTLRKVIDVLVQKRRPGQTVVVPYRESYLTWILADNFGGNSKTAMIANVSPHSSCWLETESTLRYATLAKGIINRVRVNEDPSAKLIRELQAQLKALQREMAVGPGNSDRVKELEEQMEENKKAMEELHVREEGMRLLIHESRMREEKLRVEKESLEKDQQKWKMEAERLTREKEELKSQLNKLADGQFESLKKGDFWMTEGQATPEPETPSSAARNDHLGLQTDDSQECPPQQLTLRRGSSGSAEKFRPQTSQIPELQKEGSTSTNPPPDEAAGTPIFLKGESPKKLENQQQHSTSKPYSAEDAPTASDQSPQRAAEKSKAATIGNSQSFEGKPPLGQRRPTPNGETGEISRSTANTSPQPARVSSQLSKSYDPEAVTTSQQQKPPTPGSTPESVRYGRRAMTEEGKDRESVKDSSDSVYSNKVSTAEASRPGRRRLDSSDNNNTQVPLTLMHLAPPPKPGSTTSKAPQKVQGMPDALDSFLSGGTPTNPPASMKNRAVPPWRQKRT